MSQDLFNGTNGTSLSTHDANWTAVNSSAIAQIQSNNARPNSTYNYCHQYYNGSQQNYSEVTLAAQTTGNAEHRGVSIYSTGAQYGYVFHHSAVTGSNFTAAVLEKNGSWVASSSAYTQAYGSAHTLRVTYTGGHAYGFVAGTQQLDYTDASPPSAGYDGFFTWAQATLDADLDVQDWTNGAAAGGNIISVNMSGGMQQLTGGING